MWLKRSRNLLICLWLMGSPYFLAELASAQTPIDSNVTGLLGALRGPWGQVIVVCGVMVIALTILIAIQHPIALLYAGIGFFVLFLIGAALNGSIYAWIVG